VNASRLRYLAARRAAVGHWVHDRENFLLLEEKPYARASLPDKSSTVIAPLPAVVREMGAAQ